MRTSTRTILAAVLAFAPAAPALASAFTVNPMQVVLSPTVRSAVVTIRNTSPSELRFQITTFAWDQDDRGAMKLTDPGAQTLVVFPQLLTLAPGAQKQIRVGTDAAAPASEVSYRIFFEELPSSTAKPGNGVQIRTRVGLPVFVRPAGTLKAEVQIQQLKTVAGHVALQVRNTGKAHIVVDTVRLKGTDASGKVVFTHEDPGWYLLAGRSTAYEIPVAGPGCAATSFETEVVMGTHTIRDHVAGGVPECR